MVGNRGFEPREGGRLRWSLSRGGVPSTTQRPFAEAKGIPYASPKPRTFKERLHKTVINGIARKGYAVYKLAKADFTNIKTDKFDID